MNCAKSVPATRAVAPVARGSSRNVRGLLSRETRVRWSALSVHGLQKYMNMLGPGCQGAALAFGASPASRAPSVPAPPAGAATPASSSSASPSSFLRKLRLRNVLISTPDPVLDA